MHGCCSGEHEKSGHQETALRSEFYLAQWENAKREVVVYDLADDTTEEKSPKSIFWEEYYYEEDAAAPDNRVEDILGKVETDAAVVFKKLRSFHDVDPNKIARRLKSRLTNDDIQIIRRFAAHQYFRVPGAIDHKRFELQPSGVPDFVKEMALNPGRFVESGVAYLQEAFQKLMVLLLVSAGQDYITSDWPCFDMQIRITPQFLARILAPNLVSSRTFQFPRELLWFFSANSIRSYPLCWLPR